MLLPAQVPVAIKQRPKFLRASVGQFLQNGKKSFYCHQGIERVVRPFFFDYPDAAKVPPRPTDLAYAPRRLIDLKYKTYWMRNSVKAVFRNAGFARCVEKDDPSWDVLWGKHLPWTLTDTCPCTSVSTLFLVPAASARKTVAQRSFEDSSVD